MAYLVDLGVCMFSFLPRLPSDDCSHPLPSELVVVLACGFETPPKRALVDQSEVLKEREAERLAYCYGP